MTTTTAVITAPVPLRTRQPRSARAIPTLSARRLALTLRSPRSVAVPVLAPLLFALVVAPALAGTFAPAGQRASYLTFFALSTAGLVIPLNCMFSGLGVIVDRQAGAMRELLAAPIRRSSIVLGNLVAAVVVTALQVAVLIGAAVLRGADFSATRAGWFLGSGLLLTVVMYGLAELLATRLDSPVEYTGAVPALAIVPYFFAGSLYPITSLPGWLAGIAKVLPLTHALALFRYGLTGQGGQALHNIWGMHDAAAMAALSLLVLAGYAGLVLTVALRAFTRAGQA